MATDFKIQHTWPVPRALVLEHCFDDELGDKCNAAIKGAIRTLHSKEENGGKTKQTFKVVVSDIPPKVRKVLKVLEWMEESTWDPEGERFEWKVLPSVMPGKISCGGEMFYEDKGGSTTRVVKGSIDVRIPIVGGVVEKVILDNIRRNYDGISEAESAYYLERNG
jgi:hypothetical protein